MIADSSHLPRLGNALLSNLDLWRKGSIQIQSTHVYLSKVFTFSHTFSYLFSYLFIPLIPFLIAFLIPFPPWFFVASTTEVHESAPCITISTGRMHHSPQGAFQWSQVRLDNEPMRSPELSEDAQSCQVFSICSWSSLYPDLSLSSIAEQLDVFL